MDLDALIAATRGLERTPAQRAAQVNSFAYGNAAIENPVVTREMVEEQARRIYAGMGPP